MIRLFIVAIFLAATFYGTIWFLVHDGALPSSQDNQTILIETSEAITPTAYEFY